MEILLLKGFTTSVPTYTQIRILYADILQPFTDLSGTGLGRKSNDGAVTCCR